MEVVFTTPNAGIYAHNNGDVATIVSVTASGTIAGLAAQIPIAGQRFIYLPNSQWNAPTWAFLD